MTTAHEPDRSVADVSGGQRRFPFWLWLSVPITILAVAGSITGIVFDDRIYGKETADWAAQGIGQDIANLVAFPALLLLALAAGRGSVRAYLGWIGILVYSAYTYAIYSFDVHFGPLFLVWVAVLGLSVYALIGGLASIDPVRVRSRFTGRTPLRATSVVLIAIGSIFYLLWLSEIVPPMFSGTIPEALEEAGLATNPVHVLDLAVFLPAAVLAGVLLARRRAWGYVLAPAVLVAMASLAVGIVSLMAVAAARGLEAAPGVGVAIGALAVVEVLVAFRSSEPSTRTQNSRTCSDHPGGRHERREERAQRPVRSRVRHCGVSGHRVPARGRQQRRDVGEAHSEAHRLPVPGPRPPRVREEQPSTLAVAHRYRGPGRRAHRGPRPRPASPRSRPVPGGLGAHTLLARRPDLLDRVVIDGCGVLPWWGTELIKLGVAALSPFLHTRPVIAAVGRAWNLDEEARADLRAASPRAFRRGFSDANDTRISPEEIKAPNPTLLVAGERELKPPVRASNAALAALMPNAVARFAPGQGHGWLGQLPDLHVRMVEAWLTGKDLPSELLSETTPWESPAVHRLLDEPSGRS